jgi:hypothetical protein
MTRRFPSPRSGALALAVAAALFAGSALAQWAWKDDTGRMVYSNQPPPSSVKAAQIVRQPGGVAPAPRTSGPVYGEPEKTAAPASAPAAAEPAASAAQPSAKAAAANAPKTYAERDAEFRKRQQERADAERKAQEEQQKAAQKAADCQRSRGYLKALEDGVRVTRTDPSGNREYIDDAQRAAEIDRMRKAVSDLCG